MEADQEYRIEMPKQLIKSLSKCKYCDKTCNKEYCKNCQKSRLFDRRRFLTWGIGIGFGGFLGYLAIGGPGIPILGILFSYTLSEGSDFIYN